MAVAGLLLSLSGCGQRVPDVTGMSIDKAKGVLDENGFYYEVNGEDLSTESDCRVTQQDPSPGTPAGEVAEGQASSDPTVGLVCKRHIPNVVGQEQYDADSDLTLAGFQSRVVGPSWYQEAESCRVRRQAKKGLARPGTRVPLRLKCKKRKPLPDLGDLSDDLPAPPREEPKDEPSSDLPSVPDSGRDLDCKDIDGPVAVGPDDPHNLDRDGDGEGCE